MEREIEARALEIPYLATVKASPTGWTVEHLRILARYLGQPTYPSSPTADALPQQANQGRLSLDIKPDLLLASRLSVALGLK